MSYFKQPLFKTLSAALLLCASLMFSTLAQAATINVNNTSCTLIEAINTANTGVVLPGCTAGSAIGPDTIILPSQADIVLTASNNNANGDGNNGLPSITSVITIEGNGATIRRASLASFRLIHVGAFGDLTLNDVTLSNGHHNLPFVGGGALFVDHDPSNGSDDGVAILNNCVIRNNLSDNEGGGIYSRGYLTLNDSIVQHNKALDDGGGINAGDNLFALNFSSVSNNTSGGGGGGIVLFDLEQSNIFKSTISNNTSGNRGGGIYDVTLPFDPIATIFGSTISGNTANNDGGGLYSLNELKIAHSTISNNRIINNGNGPKKGAGMYTNSYSTEVRNTIVANNSGADNGKNDCSVQPGNAPTANINNWFGDASCDGTAQGNPQLGPLADNGGPTKTHELLAGSGAIDGADPMVCASPNHLHDQRGYERKNGADQNCDIGAFERVPPIVVAGACTLNRAINSANNGLNLAGCTASRHGPNIISLSENTTIPNITFGKQGSNAIRPVTSTITIEGNGAHLSVSSGSSRRLFHIGSNADLTLKNMTLSGGVADVSPSGTDGGAIYNNGKLSLLNVTLNDNEASIRGGAIYSHALSTLAVKNSSFLNNDAERGGALYLNGTTATIDGSTLAGNTALLGTSGGGGIYLTGSAGSRTKALIGTSTIAGNSTVTLGGGIYSTNLSKVELDKTTLSGNSANVGAGIYMNNGEALISNSTLSANIAGLSGGGMFNNTGSSVTLSNVTIANNSADTLGAGLRNLNADITARNSIIANNTITSTSTHGDCENTSGSFVSFSNWFGDTSCNGVAQGDPKLGPLQDNGGPTKTHAPLVGSGALDSGFNLVCASAPINNQDQRGRKRPLGSGCDIGAVEGIADKSSFFVISLPNGKAVIINL